MPFLYLTEQGAVLRKTGERLIVEKDGAQMAEVECKDIESVLIFGNVQVTTQALAELLEHGIELALLSSHGQLRGQITPVASRNVHLRIRQYELYSDPARRLELAREIVQAKLANASAVISRHRANHPDPQLAASESEIAALMDRIAVSPLESLLGLEGAAARAYFSALAQMFRGDLPFDGRNSRPPRDPINAMLSFGYTLLTNEIKWLLDAMGFDPHIGFYHSLDYGRPSLALDLLETLRHPLVDRLALKLVNRRMLKADDFTPEADGTGGVRFTPEALKAYLAQYDQWMRQEMADPLGRQRLISWRGLLRRQIESYAAHLTRSEPFEPFTLPLRSAPPPKESP